MLETTGICDDEVVEDLELVLEVGVEYRLIILLFGVLLVAVSNDLPAVRPGVLNEA